MNTIMIGTIMIGTIMIGTIMIGTIMISTITSVISQEHLTCEKIMTKKLQKIQTDMKF
uniref:Uncharacterized protein n=1 Tax=viral metagenome TaxID=1070528 RepID=A0A6C0CCC8_9ZZZZ